MARRAKKCAKRIDFEICHLDKLCTYNKAILHGLISGFGVSWLFRSGLSGLPKKKMKNEKRRDFKMKMKI